MNPEQLPTTLEDPVPQPKLEVGWSMRAFHGKVRRARRLKGLTQGQLAAVMGVQTAVIGGVELLTRKPELRLRQELADFLGLTADEVWPDWLQPQAAPVHAVAYQEVSETNWTALTCEVRRQALQIEDHSQADPVAAAAVKELLAKNLDAVLKTLTEREREVLKLRYGIGDNEGMTYTLEECARIFGVTKERIRHIEIRAIQKLRQPVRFNALKETAEAVGVLTLCECGEPFEVARFCGACKRGGCSACFGRQNVNGCYVYFCPKCAATRQEGRPP